MQIFSGRVNIRHQIQLQHRAFSTAWFRTVNPATNTEVHVTPQHTDAEAVERLEKAQQYFKSVGRQGAGSIQERFDKLAKVKAIMQEKEAEFAQLMTTEMGKPILQAHAEVQKCIGHCDYVIANGRSFIADEDLDSPACGKAFLSTEPLGPVISIVPWNFPFWMPFKSMTSALLLGNPILLKHSPQTPQCGEALEKMFFEAGFDQGEFQCIFTDNPQTMELIANPIVKAVKFTGSTFAGRQVAGQAGAHLKKATFELGGSDPFVVLEDADIDLAISKGYISRMINNAQACINAKRFIIVDEIYDEFVSKMKNHITETCVMGDPNVKEVNLGPVVSQKQADKLRAQVKASEAEGCKVTKIDVNLDNMPKGGVDTSCYYQPTMIENIIDGSTPTTDEFFGPVFSMFRVKSEADAITLANDTEWGLGAAVFSKDLDRAERVAKEVDCGFIFINDFCQTLHDVPSGGVKNSGFGKECSKEGFHDMSNRKSIVRTSK